MIMSESLSLLCQIVTGAESRVNTNQEVVLSK